MRVVPHGAGKHDFNLLPPGQAANLGVVGNVRVEAEVSEVLCNDRRFKMAVAEAFSRGFVVVELLDELEEA